MWPFKNKNKNNNKQIEQLRFQEELLFAFMVYEKHGAPISRLIKAINFERTLRKISKQKYTSFHLSGPYIESCVLELETKGLVEKGELHDHRQFWIITEKGKEHFATLRRDQLEPTS